MFFDDETLINHFQTLLATNFINPPELDGDLGVFYEYLLHEMTGRLVSVKDDLKFEPVAFCFLDTEFLGLGRFIDLDAVNEELLARFTVWRDTMLADQSLWKNLVIEDYHGAKGQVN